ncbi:deoxyribonuclease TATDN1 isoform X2 [Periplaneta americana]|uniref:deoxyribonuclease TATDN1 isoform X2 n=1 Tax=Periplaneta americana TaxID=6978 RepID=UPI0037E7613B
MTATRKFIDIAVNLTDPLYKGIYHGIKRHEPDVQAILERAWSVGMQKMIITGGSLEDSREALHLAESHENLFSTVGCHPTRCGEFEKSGEPASYLRSLEDLILKGQPNVVAIGECGLDYDRLHFCPKETQLKYFEEQLTLCETIKLPLFLHCRNAASDFLNILSRNRDLLHGGVVHSFDGSEEDAMSILELGYYIGINGCSLKTEDNLRVVAKIPSERLVLETDCPWCQVRPTHAGAKFVKTTFPSSKKEKYKENMMVKGRNEPANIVQILEIVAGVKEEDVETLCNTIYQNTNKLFFE